MLHLTPLFALAMISNFACIFLNTLALLRIVRAPLGLLSVIATLALVLSMSAPPHIFLAYHEVSTEINSELLRDSFYCGIVLFPQVLLGRLLLMAMRNTLPAQGEPPVK